MSRPEARFGARPLQMPIDRHSGSVMLTVSLWGLYFPFFPTRGGPDGRVAFTRVRLDNLRHDCTGAKAKFESYRQSQRIYSWVDMKLKSHLPVILSGPFSPKFCSLTTCYSSREDIIVTLKCRITGEVLTANPLCLAIFCRVHGPMPL